MQIKEKLKNLIKEVILKITGLTDSVSFEERIFLDHTDDSQKGDLYSTVAMSMFGLIESGSEPKFENAKKLAERIKEELDKNLPSEILKVEVAGPGFINFYLTTKFFSHSIEEILNNKDFGENTNLSGQKIMVEYTDPNPFKPFHIGHLMTNAIGESVARTLEFSGAEVLRANYQGDVGLHVARAVFGLHLKGMPPDMSASVDVLAKHIGDSYVLGNTAYEEDPTAKAEIETLNKRIYDKSDSQVNEVYDWGFRVTMEAFEDLYRILGTKFDFYFLESQMAPIGENIVRANVGKVFEESDGAIVFKADKHDSKLHTRVFITSQGLPTYETKELGLTEEKFKVLPNMLKSIVITAHEQAEYMKVVAKALSLIHPDYENKMQHITHGMMRLASGKMGSRKGNIITGESIIRDTIALIEEKLKEREWDEEEKKKVAEKVGVAAIKYSILRSKAGSDIVFNVEESISVEGDSGPYLQYSFARANSVLEKAKKENILPDFESRPVEISEVEKLLYRFPEVVLHSATLYEPHHIASYLVEIARAFNSFYGNTIIVDKNDPASSYKVALTFAFTFVMKKGLYLLGIEAPEKM